MRDFFKEANLEKELKDISQKLDGGKDVHRAFSPSETINYKTIIRIHNLLKRKRGIWNLLPKKEHCLEKK